MGAVQGLLPKAWGHTSCDQSGGQVPHGRQCGGGMPGHRPDPVRRLQSLRGRAERQHHRASLCEGQLSSLVWTVVTTWSYYSGPCGSRPRLHRNCISNLHMLFPTGPDAHFLITISLLTILFLIASTGLALHGTDWQIPTQEEVGAVFLRCNPCTHSM